MGIKSNITIKSNIYVNKTKSHFDKDFICQIRGYSALKKIYDSLGTLHRTAFTKAQQDEIEFGNPECSLDKSGDKSWGLVNENGRTVFVCKCEKTDCKGWRNHKGYSECSNYSNFRKIERKTEIITSMEDKHIALDFSLLRYLDPDDKIIYMKNAEALEKSDISSELIIEAKAAEIIVTSKGRKEKIDIEVPQTINDNPPILNQNISPIDEINDDASAIVEYKRIDKPDEIIESRIEYRMIVNAGPGTGKTYSVIKRLEYIINNRIAEPTNILILCYSRSAVGEIKRRINDEINCGNMSSDAILLFNSIRTFDSFVTYMLSEDDFEGSINSLNYDERIEKFIVELQKEKTILNGLEYLIVDEMQDLVGVRARMVKAILEQINCGFLLLGDTCQSIYDYQIKDMNELNSYRYYKWLNGKFGKDIKRFELTKNVRQKEELAMFSEYMRGAILSDDNNKQTQALSLCIDTLQNDNYVGNVRKIGEFGVNESTAILCRNNAEVSLICTELFASGIEHLMLKRAQHIDLVPWIAEILSTYTQNKIGFTEFIERALSVGYKDGDIKWKLLKSVAADDNEKVLDIRLLVQSLVSGKDIPSELDLSNVNALTVSTIHRSKGREYDQVILISEDYTNNNTILDEVKVAYVALTRAKERISFCSLPNEYNRSYIKKYFEKVKRIKNGERERFYAYMWNPRKKNKYPFCSNFELGLDGDVNIYSFVLNNHTDIIQDNIKKLKRGDRLQAKLEEGCYRLYNDYDQLIGELSKEVLLDICTAMEEKNQGYKYYGNYEKPSSLIDIYVNNIVTIANTRFSDVIAQPYNKSGLWLGIEICGFAKTDWS